MSTDIAPTVTTADWSRGLFDIAHFANTVLGVQPHAGQARWLAKSHERENLLVTGNRWGKSFVSAIKLLHHALYRPRALCYDRAGRYRAVTASITQDQANIIFDTVVRIARQSAWLEPLIESIKRTPFPTIRFTNGSTIEARSTQNRGEYLLGNDYDYFIFDEVSFESDPEYVVEEVILMRLADREGKLDLVSTPNGKNWFYLRARNLIEKKRPGYFQSGDSRENQYISKAYLEERVAHFTEARLKQNIQGQFVDAGGEVLKGSYVDRALDRFAAVVLRSNVSYISGWDLARKQTATVGITIAVVDRFATVIAFERLHGIDWPIVQEHIVRRQLRYPGRLVIDATGLGDVVAQELSRFKPQPVIFTPQTKAELLTNVELFHAKDMIAYQRWELPDGPGRTWSFEDELRSARWDDNNRCDSLMALALALWPLAQRDGAIVQPRVGKL